MSSPGVWSWSNADTELTTSGSTYRLPVTVVSPICSRNPDTDRERLQRAAEDLTRRQNSVLRQAQDGDPDDPFTKALRNTYNELETEKSAALTDIARLDTTDKSEPGRPADAEDRKSVV